MRRSGLVIEKNDDSVQEWVVKPPDVDANPIARLIVPEPVSGAKFGVEPRRTSKWASLFALSA